MEDKWGGLFHALRNSLEISKYAPSTSRVVTSMSRLDISTSDVDDAENIKAADNIVENDISGEEIKLEELETRMW
ncbi:hypothetical protein Tco_0199639 [Tanacetum coccineum]